MRIGSFVIYGAAAVAVVYFGLSQGRGTAPQAGQDLARASLEEMIVKEQNKHRDSGVTIPDLSDLVPDAQIPNLVPFVEREKAATGLSGESESLIEPTMEGTTPSGKLPPFLSERQDMIPVQQEIKPKHNDMLLDRKDIIDKSKAETPMIRKDDSSTQDQKNKESKLPMNPSSTNPSPTKGKVSVDMLPVP